MAVRLTTDQHGNPISLLLDGTNWPIDTVREALRNIERAAKLEHALKYYVEAVVVANWGMQELADDSAVAREALGITGGSWCPFHGIWEMNACNYWKEDEHAADADA
jgi:hypothetical protein